MKPNIICFSHKPSSDLNIWHNLIGFTNENTIIVQLQPSWTRIHSTKVAFCGDFCLPHSKQAIKKNKDTFSLKNVFIQITNKITVKRLT